MALSAKKAVEEINRRVLAAFPDIKINVTLRNYNAIGQGCDIIVSYLTSPNWALQYNWNFITIHDCPSRNQQRIAPYTAQIIATIRGKYAAD